MQRLLCLGQTLLFMLLVLNSCKPMVREDGDSLTQGVGAARAVFRNYLANKEYSKARQVVRMSLESGDHKFTNVAGIAKTRNADEFLASYVEKDLADIDNIIASIVTSAKMDETLSLLRKIPKELDELQQAQRDRRQVAALIVFSNDVDLFQKAVARWSADSSQWLKQTEQKLTLAVTKLLATSEFAQTSYASKHAFEQAVVRINKALQKVKDNLAVMRSSG